MTDTPRAAELRQLADTFTTLARRSGINHIMLSRETANRTALLLTQAAAAEQLVSEYAARSEPIYSIGGAQWRCHDCPAKFTEGKSDTWGTPFPHTETCLWRRAALHTAAPQREELAQ